MDSAIHQTNRYPVDSATVCFSNTYPLDGDLSDIYWYPSLSNLGLESMAFTHHNMPDVRNLHPHTLFRLRRFMFDFFFQVSEVFLSRSP